MSVSSRCGRRVLMLMAVMSVVVPRFAQAQTPVTLSPSQAATSGGTVLKLPNSQFYSSATATVDGTTAQVIVNADGVWIVSPPHLPGQVPVLVTAVSGPSQTLFTATITYVDLPQVGIQTPVSRVSLNSAGVQSTTISTNGAGSHSTASSGDGRYVAFLSDSRFAGFTTYSTLDLYRKDLLTGALDRLSLCGAQCYTPSISLDGSRVAARVLEGGPGSVHGVFVFDAPFLAAPIRADLDAAGNPPVSGAPSAAMLSGNGRWVAFATTANLDADITDTGTTSDLFVRDLNTNSLTRWTTGAAVSGNVAISASGGLVAFITASALVAEDINGLRDVYLLDRVGGTLRLLTPGANGQATRVAISSDGSTVAFDSAATNLVVDDTNSVGDVFVADVATGAITRVSVSSTGAQVTTTATLGTHALSGNGRRVAFASTTSALTSAPLPTGVTGVFVHDRSTAETFLVNAAGDGTVAGPTFSIFTTIVPSVAMTPDGHAATFSSHAPNLVALDTNSMIDAFLKEMPADTPAGTDVVAEPVDAATGETPVALAFDSISVAGDTTVVISDQGPALPGGFALGSRYFDISTTAAFAGTVTLCVVYDPETTSDPAVLRLLHYEASAWVDITTSYDADTHVVCGETSSLSPFVIAEVLPPAFSVQSLLEEGQVFKVGRTVPIRVRILDGSGANVSSPSLPLVATGLRLASTQTDWVTPEGPGRSNPDLAFQFTTVKGEPGYRFNLKTAGLAAGTWELQFTVGAGGPSLTVQFQLR